MRDILIVEDSPTQAEKLKYILEQHDYQVSVTKQGQQALAWMEKRKPVLVISDIMMPEMDGYETMQVIRQNSLFRRLPIIALTAKAMKGDREKCLEAGASEYLAKPVNTEQLLSALRMWLHR